MNCQLKPSGPYFKTDCPERELWQQVVVRALLDAALKCEKYDSRGHLNYEYQAREEAKEWLNGHTQDFFTVCHLAGFDPHFIREKYAAGQINFNKLRNVEAA